MAQPIYEPAPAMGGSAAPSAMGLPPKAANNNTRNIAISCGCLTLCLCAVIAVVAYNYLPGFLATLQ